MTSEFDKKHTVRSNTQVEQRPVMLIKAKCYILACAIMFSTLICLVVFASVAAESDEEAAKKAVQSFLTMLDKREISRVEVYYLNWNLLTLTRITEDLLQKQQWDFKVVGRLNLIGLDLDEFKKSLSELKFKKVNWRALDFRLGYIFYSSDKEVLRLFFAGNIAVVSINGVPFEATTELVRSLMTLLPVKAYEQINWGMMRLWESSGARYLRQKAASADVREPNKPKDAQDKK